MEIAHVDPYDLQCLRCKSMATVVGSSACACLFTRRKCLDCGLMFCPRAGADEAETWEKAERKAGG